MSGKRYGTLVGVDGSEASMRAVDWAASDAAVGDTDVTVCFVTDIPALVDVPLPPEVRQDAGRYGQRMVDKALVRLRAAAPEVSASGLVAGGNPAAELLLMAADADQVVLGTRGAGGFEQLVLGSVSAQVAAHAPGPVVVVRGEPAGSAVVVGVDGSELGERALEYGFGYAARHRLSVHAVHAYPSVALLPPVPASVSVPPEEVRGSAERLLNDTVDGWSAKYPAVPVRTTVVHGSAAGALAEASKGSALLVVGSRGHGGFAGLLLGSVSQAALRHSACPVAVVR